MAQDEMMKYFIDVASWQPITESTDLEMPDPVVDYEPVVDNDEIIDKLKDALFKFDSFYREGSKDYTEGLQDGLNYAMEVISRIVESSEGNTEDE